jgi:ELWxxDGT repeat protein
MSCLFRRPRSRGLLSLAQALWSPGRRGRRSARHARSGIESLETRLALASAPSLVVDLNAVPASAAPREIVAAGDVAYFTATDPVHGRELWVTDGTPAGTRMVGDIEPGPAGSDPGSLTLVGSTLFFAATTGGDRELWKTDGTASGTLRVRDIKIEDPYGSWGPPDFSSRPESLTAVDGTLFFSADDGWNGRELWKSDGTPEGTVLVTDLLPGTSSSWDFEFARSGFPRDLTAFQGRLFFVATVDDGERSGDVLWVSDGTAEGTAVVAELAPDLDATPSGLVAAAGALFFAASGVPDHRALWTSDGTSAGTRAVATVLPQGAATEGGNGAFAIRDIVPFGDGVLFAGDDGTSGSELWTSDGTTEGTRLLADIHAERGSDPSEITVVGPTAYFAAADVEHGRELWATDGTAEGTRLVEDVRPGAAGSGPAGLAAIADGIGFAADDGLHGREPWVSDGLVTGLVRDIRPDGDGIPEDGSASFAAVARLGGRLLFAADDGGGAQVWSSDGRAAGTVPASAIENGTTRDAFDAEGGSGSFVAKAILDGFLYFPADDGIHGQELWKSDGTAEGTRLVADLAPGPEGSDIREVVALGGTVLVVTGGGMDWGPPIPQRLLAIGTTGTSTLLAEGRFDRTGVAGGAFFALLAGGEILRSDGTPGGTSVVDDSGESEYGWSNGFATVGDRLFYGAVADVMVDGVPQEVHSIRVVGATGGVSEAVAEYGGEDHGDFIEALGTLFLVRSTYEDGDGVGRTPTLWRLDESLGLVQVSVGWGIGYGGSTEANGELFFTASTVAGLELRATDGTPAGTRVVATLGTNDTDDMGVAVESMQAFGGGIAFVVSRGFWYGNPPLRSLWLSDGTPAGTRMVVDAIDAIEGIVDGKLVYRATDGDGVARLSFLDGETIPSVSPRTDSAPALLGVVGDTMLVVASDIPHGRELFALPLVEITVPGPAGVPVVAAGNARASLSWTAPASDGGAAVSDYVVERSSDGGATWTPFADGISTATTATLTGLVNGVGYRFRVAAVNAAGTGAFGDPSAAVVPVGLPEALAAPVAIPADRTVTVTWAAPASDGGLPISDYSLETSRDGGGTWTPVTRAASTATTATLAGLVNGTAYRFRVSAVNALGAGPASGSSLPAIPAKPAGVPTAVRAVRGDRQVTLSWKAPANTGGSPITDYSVQQSTDGGKTWSAVVRPASAATSATVSGLANGVAVVLRVAAVNSVGRGAFTPKTAAVVPAATAGAPTGLTATRGNGRVSLSWTAPGSNGGLPVTNYLLQQSTDGGVTWKNVARKASSAVAATVTGLANGRAIEFRVAAVNGVGTGAFGAASTPVVPAALAAAPAGLVAVRGDTLVSLAWRAPVATGGVAITDYVVQRSSDGGKTWTTVADAVSTATTATVTGLVNGTASVFRVAAVNEVGVGPFTARSGAVVPATVPGLPAELVATRKKAAVTLTWRAPASNGGAAVSDYRVEWSSDGGSTWKALARPRSPAPSATIGKLSEAQGYRFRVAAVNAVGRGAFTEVTSDVPVK